MAARGGDGGDNNSHVRFRCKNCGRMLRADERPCSNCGSDLREIIPIVTERVSINERRSAILRRAEIHLYFLLATIAVMIGVPVYFFFFVTDRSADWLSTVISVGAGFLAFYLGYRALVKVKEVYEPGR